MKLILLILIVIPFTTIAQSKKTSSTKPPLIKNITSDTVKGIFYQVLFTYDQSNRVIGIVQKKSKIISAKRKSKKVMDQIIRQQSFEYTGSAIEPVSRKLEAFEYNDFSQEASSWYLASQAQQYFLFKNGKRIGDSTLLLERDDDTTQWKEKAYLKLGVLKETSNTINHYIDLNRTTNNYGSGANIYSDAFELNAQSNISKESSRYDRGGRNIDWCEYRFSKYDAMLNPLKQLNIAHLLVNEKICLYDGNAYYQKNENWKVFRGGHYGNVDLSWYFINKNNPVSYSTKVNDESSPFKQVFNLSYRYNQFKQPIYAKAEVKYFFKHNDKLYSKQESYITFRYQ